MKQMSHQVDGPLYLQMGQCRVKYKMHNTKQVLDQLLPAKLTAIRKMCEKGKIGLKSLKQ